jgi:hypothetical protein
MVLVPLVLAIVVSGCDLSGLERTGLTRGSAPRWTSVAGMAASVSALRKPRSVLRSGSPAATTTTATTRSVNRNTAVRHTSRALGGVKPILLRYDETAYLLNARTKRVFSMIVSKRGATTRAGVGVGDPLSRVRRKYGDAVCGRAVAGEPLFGGETPTYPWCRVRLGDIEVFFGDDPVESITVTRKK